MVAQLLVGREESKQLKEYAAPFLALSIEISDALPLLSDAKQLVPTATGAEKTAFRFAGMKIERIKRQEQVDQQMRERAGPRGGRSSI